QPIPRATLMAQFWPDADPRAGRNCLNVALHTVRSVMRAVTSAPILLFENDAYRFNPAITVWVDTEEFDARLAEAQRLERDGRMYAALAEYGQAVGLYRGEFMADEPYLDWPIVERVRLRMLYLDALDRLSRQYLEHDQTAECIQLCHLMLRHDNCHEEAHHRLMQCYARQGQRHLAMQQYHICVATLRAELSVPPGDAITRLYRVLRRQLTT
ncbi:MAG: bacterial transcriptional activator domain-containing protein, partial [Anaerolineae bacterium]|nr:bacterial transcriptional activator domain-containing protein [Anaerolineae bacterium]